MTTATGRSRCVTCGKEKAILKCGGCSQDFCFNHFGDHRQELNKQLDDVEVHRDLFRQTLTEQTGKPQKHPLIQQIDQWERDSINKIRQTAEEARQTLLQHTNGHIKQIEVNLNKLTNQLRQSREENDFVETDLRQWNEQLTQLSDELNKSSNVTLREDSKPFVSKLYVDIATASLLPPNIDTNTRWSLNGITIAGGNGEGDGLHQLNDPMGIYIGEYQTMYIADYNNHRIVEWKSGATKGQVVAGGNGPGDRSDQLNGPTDVIVDKTSNSLIICDKGNERVMQWPCRNGTTGQAIISNVNCRGLAIDNQGYLYVCDRENHEVKRWQIGDKSGVVVAGGNGQGDRLDQLHLPTNIFVDEDYSVYVSDQHNNRVMKWVKDAKKGVVVAGNQGQGSGLKQLYRPYRVIVNRMGTVYVADSGNHRMMRWCKGAEQGRVVVGANGPGVQANQFQWPTGMVFDKQGNLYVADMSNFRVQKFNVVSS